MSCRSVCGWIFQPDGVSMRLALVILLLAGIALAMVHLRRERNQLLHETQHNVELQIMLRRKLWDQQVRLAWLMAPAEIRKRVEDLSLHLAEKSAPAGGTPDANGSPRATRR
jgi:hypothetical protein